MTASLMQSQRAQTLLKNLHLRRTWVYDFEIFFTADCAGGLLLAGSLPLQAQGAKDAKEIVRAAMQAELAADLNDHSRWRYRDAQKDGTNTVSIVVETDHGSVKRLISQEWAAVDVRRRPGRRTRGCRTSFTIRRNWRSRKRMELQDEKNAEELLRMLPEAFMWKVESEDAREDHAAL